MTYMRTKLTPYLREVYEWRMKGHTWREIEELLGEKGLKTSYSQVRRWFMNQRKKGRELQEAHEDLKVFFMTQQEEREPTAEELAKEQAQVEAWDQELRPIEKDVEKKTELEDWEKELEENYKQDQENRPRPTKF